MPGSARMYPETDVPPIKVTKKLIKGVKDSLPDHPDDVADKLNKLLNPELASQMMNSEKLKLFFDIVKEGIDTALTATTLLFTEPEIKKRFASDTNIPDEIYKEVLWLYNEGKISKGVIFDVLHDYTMNPRNLIEILGDFKQIGEEEVRQLIEKIIKEKPGLNFAAYMGIVMQELRGRVDGGIIAKILKSLL